MHDEIKLALEHLNDPAELTDEVVEQSVVLVAPPWCGRQVLPSSGVPGRVPPGRSRVPVVVITGVPHDQLVRTIPAQSNKIVY